MYEKSLGFILAMLCFTFMCTSFHYNHVHSSECGNHGENCTHECSIVEPRRDETSTI